ncbi:MAG: acyl-CoA synthetase [Azospirillaceae bacterium]
MLPDPGSDGYAALVRRFRWRIPARFNIGTAAIDAHADGSGRLALTDIGADGAVRRYSFDDLKRLSNRFANLLVDRGARRGDRVGILLSQGVGAGIAHIAAYKAGLIALPLFTLFGPEALEYRLADSGARFLVTDAENAAKLAPVRDRLPDLETVYLADGADGDPGDGTIDLWAALARARDDFTAIDTAPDDPALIIYTSGTTGQPKGALHAHRVLLGHLPGVELPHRFFHLDRERQQAAHFWTPADWAWIGGLLDVLLPAWFHGVPVLAQGKAKFDPEAAARLIGDHQVRHAFLPPTALKLMRQAEIAPVAGLRSIGSGGETLGAELLDWGRRTFGLTINEFYGQTECNLIVGNCDDLFTARPGSMGRPIPGHDVAVVDGEGRVLPPGEAGQIAVRRGDPVMFLGYWNNEAATAAKFLGPSDRWPGGQWMATGDTGRADADGYLWFVGRDDDVITSAGYRIGPGEIEDCLLRHPAVAMAAAVGVPDPVRTEVVKAVIVPKPGVVADDNLAEEIRAFVRTRLAAHEYPRLVEFRDALPMTATGKIIRRELRDGA